MSEQGNTRLEPVSDIEQPKKGSRYLGQMVTPTNYNLFSKEERQNAHRHLESYLKGRDTYKAKVLIPNKKGEKTWQWVIKQVERG